MAYLCGFFAADGYITVNRRGGQFWCIDITDKNLLFTIKKLIDSEHKISTKKRVDGHTSYRIQIGSIEMCDDLRKLGYDERKTKSLVLPNVPHKYFMDFIRGYFDGDGNVWTGITHKDRLKTNITVQTVFTSCSKTFLEGIMLKLSEFGIEKGVIRKGGGDYHRLTYSVNGSLKLYDFMYNSLGTSKLFLKRKKDVFEKYIKMRS